MPARWKPVKLSPVHHRLTEQGAVFAEVAGWLVAAHFGDAEKEAQALGSGVGLCDLSASEKWEIKGTDSARFLASALGMEVPEPGKVARTDSGTLYRFSRHHALLVLDLRQGLSAPQGIVEGPRGGCVHVTDRTSGLGRFLLCGPAARGVLAKLTSLDLREGRFPALSCAGGPMASLQVLLGRMDRAGLPAYEIFFSREYGEYLWEVIMEAGEEFHLQPFGVNAEGILETGRASALSI